MTTLRELSALTSLGVLLAASHSISLACSVREPTQVMGPGPHDYSGAPAQRNLWREGDAGEPLLLRVRVLGTCAEPVAGARVQILHANQDGIHEHDRWRADLRTDARGELEVVTVYPGYAGSLPRHIHFIISHPEHEQLVTRLFFKSDPAVGYGIEDLAIVVEEIRRGASKSWLGGYEFVLRPK